MQAVCRWAVTLLLVLPFLSLEPLAAQEVTISGDVSPSPAGSPTWSVSNLNIGDSGVGSLTIDSGGLVSASGQSSIGNQAGSNGSATVNGGTWNSFLFSVGEAGTGELVINSGLVSNSNSSFMAFASGSTGNTTVNGGTLSNAQGFLVGGSGTANLTVSGGTVSSAFTRIGVSAGGVGNIKVTSGALNSTSMEVGFRGTGHLVITGGTVSADRSRLGTLSGSTGTAMMSGGSWTNTDYLSVGQSGTGTMLMTGGLVSNANGYVGENASGTGSMTMSGGTWSNSNSLSVGKAGNGSLQIQDDAIVSVAGGAGTVKVAEQAGSTGTVNFGSYDLLNSTRAGTLEAAAVVFGAGTGTVNFNQNHAFTFDKTISGAGRVVQRGSGTTTLTEASSYTGGTLVSGGTLHITDDSALGTGPVAVTGGTLSSSGDLYVGGTSTSDLEIVGNGVVSVAGGAGTVRVADLAGSTGALNFGAYDLLHPTSVGTLEAAGIVFGAGTGTVNFNQNDAFSFDTPTSGAGQVVQRGSGTTTLTGPNTYSGGTAISGGMLRTTDVGALGSGAVALNTGGTLAPMGTLGITQLDWNGGAVTSTLGATSSFLDIDGDLNLTGPGTFNFLSGTGFEINQEYLLLSAGNLSLYAVADFVGTPNSIFRLDVVTGQLFVSFIGTTTGPVLQNDGPYFTLSNADFLVNGAVKTGSPVQSNTVNGLIFNPGSSLQVFNDLTVSSGNFTVDAGSATVAGGQLISPGDFAKLGAGVLNILSDVLVNGAANLNMGSLFVNGLFTTNGGLAVFQNAFLGGSGIINGDVVNNGTVAPGNSPGSLTVNGDFTQTSVGTLQVEVGSATVFDQLLVSGSANLAGTLQVLNFGGNQFTYGQQVPFLQAGSISGEFDQILMPNPSIFRGRFLVDGETGLLLVAPTSYTLVAQTTNQQNVARALDSFIPATSGDRLAVSTALDLQSAEQYPAAFDQIAPTFYESLANITIEQTNAQNQMLAQRLSAVRLGVRGFQAIGIEAPLVHDKSGKSVLDAKDGKDILTPGPDNKWGVWAQGNGIFAKVTNVSQVPNYRFQSGGFLAGADYQWSEGLTTGLFAGYQGLYAKYNGGGSNTINSALFGGYATYQKGGFYSDLIVSGGYSNYNVRRPINFSTVDRTAVSKPDGGQFNTYLDFGYDWKVGGFTFGPILAGQYTYAGIAPFTESGADSLDLRVNQQNANSLRTSLGGRVAYTWNLTDKIAIIPEVRMLWQHEFLNNPRNIGAALDGGNGPAFGYETSAPARDSVFAGAGVSAQFGDRWNAYFYYNADFGRQDFVSNMISGGLGWKF